MIDIDWNKVIANNCLKIHCKSICAAFGASYGINLCNDLCTIDSFGRNDFGKYAGNSCNP